MATMPKGWRVEGVRPLRCHGLGRTVRAELRVGGADPCRGGQPRRPGDAVDAAPADRPARTAGLSKREIRGAAVPATAYRRLAPVPHLPEAEHHLVQRVVVPHRRQLTVSGRVGLLDQPPVQLGAEVLAPRDGPDGLPARRDSWELPGVDGRGPAGGERVWPSTGAAQGSGPRRLCRVGILPGQHGLEGGVFRLLDRRVRHGDH